MEPATTAGSVSTGALPGRPGSRLRFELVTTGNEDAVRRLLHDTPVPGWISLAYEREPDYLLGATLEGPVQQTVLARRAEDGAVVGTFSRSERLAYVNGRVRTLGYLGLLRMDTRFRGRTIYLREGYEACRRCLHDPARTPFYVTSIIEGNTTARRVLEAGLPGLPVYRPWQRFATLALPISARAVPAPAGVRLLRCTTERLVEVASCLQRNYARYALAPYWSADDLASGERCRGLGARDFLIAERNGRVVGCIALWDQRAFKQHVVQGYAPRTERWRRSLNLVARVLSLPRLPDVGSTLNEACLSHAAVDDDDAGVLLALISAALQDARLRGLDFVTLGLAACNPMLGAVKARFRHLEYRSILYVVHWQDGRAAARDLDDRPVHLEAAAL